MPKHRPNPNYPPGRFRTCERCKATTEQRLVIEQLTDCALANDRPWLCSACHRLHVTRCPLCQRRIRARMAEMAVAI